VAVAWEFGRALGQGQGDPDRALVDGHGGRPEPQALGADLVGLQAAGKSKREALRVLKRRLVRVVFNLLHADLNQARRD
jgi:hypothetical protein